MLSWRRILASLVCAVTILAACSGQDSISSEDLDRAEKRWATSEPDAFHWRADGSVNGRGVDIDLIIADGVIESDNGSRDGKDFTVDGLFAQMRAALNEGTSVEGSLHADHGYPTRVLIGDHVDLTTRDFIPIDQTTGCPAAPGSSTDLSSEPVTWLLYTDYHRWTDADGCEVRVDVIRQYQGPEHCDWETATFITVGTPIGTAFTDTIGARGQTRTYIWDPEGALDYIDGVKRNVSLPADELPDSAAATGFRDGTAQLWLDAEDPTVLYRVAHGQANRYVVDEPRQILCE